MANEYRVSQFAFETLDDGDGTNARVSQFAFETLDDGDGTGARVSMFALEVLESLTTTPLSSRRRQIVN